MPYLPDTLEQAKVLITVKTYPLPSNKYEELVCTAGVLEDGKWIRIYPIPFRSLPKDKKFQKYEWIQADLIRNKDDFRPESYRPKSDASNIRILEKIGTGYEWAERKKYVLKEVFTSFEDLIRQAKSDSKKSLATFRPLEIVDFIIEEDKRTWKEQWQANYEQYDLFEIDESGKGLPKEIIRKVPYKYSYQFICEDKKQRTLMIEDWEIGALYWHCLEQAEGDEDEANRLVRLKYFDEFLTKKDIHLFVGTTKKYHAMNAPNPFVIIGVFYPPTKKDFGQGSLFP